MSNIRDRDSVWGQFCRDEGRQAAWRFMEQVRRYQDRHPSSGDVTEQELSTEFADYFLEEVRALTTPTWSSGSNKKNERKVSSSSVKSGAKPAKSWWNIFKNKLSKSTEGGSRKLSGAGIITSQPDASIVQEGLVCLLNMNDPVQPMSWQQCRLVLTHEQENYQLEIFCPPKSQIPKMSLFCFLIEEVRSTTALELPDLDSAFAIKSQNNSEYVFDAGCEDSKLQWIRAIQLVCRKDPLSNGHLPTTQPSGVSNGHIPTSTEGLLAPKPAPPSRKNGVLHRPLPANVSPSPDMLIESLTASPVIYGRKTSSQEREEEARAVMLRQSVNSEDSILYDMSVFLREHNHRSPSRLRKAQSMFVESPASCVHGLHPSASPHTTPPAVPKRIRQNGISSQAVCPVDIGASSSSDQSEPKRKFSHPSIVRPPVLSSNLGIIPDPGSLESCLQSSSTSALHAVSLAAAAQRLSTSIHTRMSSVPSAPSSPEEVHRQKTPARKDPADWTRKMSAPVGPGQFGLEGSQVRPEQKKKFSSATGVNLREGERERGSELILLEEEGDHLPRYSAGRGHGRSDRENASTSRQSSSPLTNTPTPTRGSAGAEPPTPPPRRFDPYASVLVTPATPCQRIPSDSSYPSDAGIRQTEGGYSTRSSSVSDPDQVSPSAANPIYVETTGTEGYSYQGSTYTHHPYESWATSQLDVENLRALAHYPWFHGMISRANASQLVLAEGEVGSGQYLVRQSESREGDFVLTFNYHNRAKHLRMTVDEAGCNIQHLWFDDVPNMLEYFKTNSIPLESFWLNDDVKLTSFIDRAASDAFRTTTILNTDQLPRVPPRRSRSLQLAMTQGTNVGSGISPATPSPTEFERVSSSSGSSSRGDGNSVNQSNSLPQSVRNGLSWWQFFRSQRSSSAGNVGRIQRRHSTNAGSVMDARRGRNENNYVYRL